MRKTEMLTEREMEVLELVAEGMSNKEISEKLCITVHTVKAHISSVMRKFHSNNRTQIAIIGFKHGILQQKSNICKE